MKRWKAPSRSAGTGTGWRTRVLLACFALSALVLAGKLFFLQVLDHAFYEALASGQHSLFKELFPERGDILIHDAKEDRLVALATNEQLALVYADPRQMHRTKPSVDPTETAKTLGEILGLDEAKTTDLAVRLSRPEDPYEPVASRIPEETLKKIIDAKLSGIGYVRESVRIYPEQDMGGHVTGFVGADTEGRQAGRYGIEGRFDEALTGVPGFLRSERDIAGRIIAVGDRAFEPAVDGADVVLTIDRTVQYMACSKLQRSVAKHGADGGSLVVLEVATGRVLAMCGSPDFDPNAYGDVTGVNTFNNPAIFQAYEPGSVFKPVTMAAALDTGSVIPDTTFEDTGSVMVDGWYKPIANAEGKSYGVVSMTRVLEDSINTGMVFAMRQMGMDPFTSYVKQFGFGAKTGIELDTEMPGDVSPLDIGGEVYAATASFGQGITVTPLQLASAYAAIANGGVLLEPHVVDEVRYTDGRIDKTSVKEQRRIMQEKTSHLLGAMLISVVENGHGTCAGVPGYYVGGKTGTAQVPTKEGYDENVTIGSFAGFAPANDPRFVIMARVDNPKDVKWAESTAAPLFGDMMDFLLRYYEVPPTRPMDEQVVQRFHKRCY